MTYDLASKDPLELRRIMYSNRHFRCDNIDPSIFFERILSVYGKDSLSFDNIITHDKDRLNIRMEWPHDHSDKRDLDLLLHGAWELLRGSESYTVCFGIKGTRTWKEFIGSDGEDRLTASLIRQPDRSLISPSDSEVCRAMPDDLRRICEAYLSWASELKSLTKQI